MPTVNWMACGSCELHLFQTKTNARAEYKPPNSHFNCHKLYKMCVPGMSTGAYRKDMQIGQREQPVEGNICPQDAWKSRSP